MNIFKQLENINTKPKPFEFYTAEELWTDEYTAAQMLQYHLNESVNLSSRNHALIDRSAEWIISRFNVNKDSAIADFGCGPGLYTTRLAKTGADVTGIDFSKNSIEYARSTANQNGLDITYVNQNYLEFDSDKHFDLIIMIMCDFCVLSPDQRKTLLQVFSKHLKPGGFILLDVYTLTGFDQRQESASYELNQLNGFWSPDTYYGFVNSFKYETEKVTLDKYTIIEENRTRTVYNWLQYFSPESLNQEFAENGFQIEEFFSDVAGTLSDPNSSEMAVIGKKL